MAYFVLFGHDVEDSTEKRKQTRPEHLHRIQLLNEQGRVLLAGPCPKQHGDAEMLGSLMVIDFENKLEAETWAQAEPYLKAGVYSHIDIYPYVPVLPSN